MIRVWVRSAALMVVVLLLIAGAAMAWVKLAPRQTPAGQPPLAELSSGNLAPFADAFNADTSVTRVVAMLSPT